MSAGRDAAQLEYAIQDKVRQELGYNGSYIYKSAEEEEEIHKKTDLDREIMLAERHEQVNALLFKFRTQHQLEQQRAKQEREMKAKTQLSAKEPPRKRARHQESDSDSGSSGSSRSSYSDDSDDENSYSSDDESDASYGRRRRRDIKADEKGRDRRRRESNRGMIKVDSSDDESSYDSRHHSGNRGKSGASGDPRAKTTSGDQKEAAQSDLIQEVDIKEFQKICMRRRDLCKWIEIAEFQKGIKGAFVRVCYRGQYVIGQIDQFKEGAELYRVEQRETKLVVTLKNAGKFKDFKLNLVSDGLVSEKEFKNMQRLNKQINVDKEFINRLKDKIREASKIQYDRSKLSQLVYKQNIEKIKRGNFKGMNLTDIKVTLLGEVAIAESHIREAQELGVKAESLEELYKKANQLKELQRKVNIASLKDDEHILQSESKMGARLKARDELQEWLEKQEDLRKNPEKEGSNIFTYRKNRSSQHGAELLSANDNLNFINDVNLLRLKSQQGQISGQPTQENSVIDEIQKWSYFEKLERLKKKIVHVHQSTTFQAKPDAWSGLRTEAIHLTDGIQVPHPDWCKERLDHQERLTKVAAAATEKSGVISLADYLQSQQ